MTGWNALTDPKKHDAKSSHDDYASLAVEVGTTAFGRRITTGRELRAPTATIKGSLS